MYRCTGVQNSVVDGKSPCQHGQGAEQIGITRSHLVVLAITGHGVKSAMMDWPFGLVIFKVINRIKRIAIEKLGPVGMGHCAGFAACPGYFGKQVRLPDPEPPLVRNNTVNLGRYACMDGGIARAGG